MSAVALLSSCGNFSQATARDLATTHSCDWYAKCGEIGAGKTFETRDSCEVNVRVVWNATWPLDACDGKIPSKELDSCLNAIDNTQCANGLDLFNTLFNKCAQAQVCVG
jgi:hypothetical protein